MKDKLPGVYTHVTVDNTSTPDWDDVNAIMSTVGGIAGQPTYEFNHFMTVGREVAKYYKLDAEKRLDEFYKQLFWIAVYGVDKE